MPLKRTKKLGWIGAGAAVLAISGGLIWWKNGATPDLTAYVDSLSMITGQGMGVGFYNRYSGIVEPQQTIEIQRNEERKIKEIYVKVGDVVEDGTPLFAYDSDETRLKLSQVELDLERMNAQMTNLTEQIKLLEAEKANASADEKLMYTTQILESQNELKRMEYDKKSKSVEIEHLKKSLENSTVVSSVAGVVKAINKEGYDVYGQAQAFLTILSTGDYRVKGTIEEQNVWTLTEGQRVVVRSRVDNSMIWTGAITLIDLEKPDSNQSNDMWGSMGGEGSSTYPFYIQLDSADGLILGQHVYIELDYGQGEIKEGIWLSEFYLMEEDGNYYVWASEENQLVKRLVTLGSYDEKLMTYEITSGLQLEDQLAFPDDRLVEGMKTQFVQASYGVLEPEEMGEEIEMDETFEEEVTENTELPQMSVGVDKPLN